LETTPAILPESLPSGLLAPAGRTAAVTLVAAAATLRDGLPDLGDGFNLEAEGDEFYRRYLALALERAGGVQTRAAELLGMSFRSFRYYAKKFNLT
jgi:two-component system response regulator PilR (NtrC family)